MSDLIYRKALQAAASEKMTVGWFVDGTPVMRETMTARELDRLIRDATAVDAAPVVHARWEKDDLGNSYCSKCDHRLPFIHVYDETDYEEWDEEIEKTPFCMYCGARMDGEAD